MSKHQHFHLAVRISYNNVLYLRTTSVCVQIVPSILINFVPCRQMQGTKFIKMEGTIIGWPTDELGINFRPEIVFGEKVESTFPWRFYTP